MQTTSTSDLDALLTECDTTLHISRMLFSEAEGVLSSVPDAVDWDHLRTKVCIYRQWLNSIHLIRVWGSSAMASATTVPSVSCQCSRGELVISPVAGTSSTNDV